MTTRRARRHRQPGPRPDLLTRFKAFPSSWAGLISFSVGMIAIVLVVGVFRIPLPFLSSSTDPAPDPWGTVTVPKGGTFHITYIGDTSNGASIDASGATAAIRQVLKDRPTVKEANVELQMVEDKCNAETATTQARQIASDPMTVAVISAACTVSAQAAAAVFEEQHVTQVLLNNHDPALTNSMAFATFRTSWNRKSEGPDTARSAFDDLNLRRGIVFYDGSTDAETVANDFATTFRQATSGPTAGQIADVLKTSTQTSDIDAASKRILQLQPEFLYFSGTGDVGTALKVAATAAGFTGVYIVSDQARNDPLLARLGAAQQGLVAAQASVAKGSGYDTWKETYERDNGTVGPLSAEAFDAAQVVLQSLDTAGRTKNDGTLELGRRQIANVVRVLPYDGVTGRFGYDGKGDRVLAMVQLVRYTNGAWVPVPKKATAAATADGGLAPAPSGDGG